LERFCISRVLLLLVFIILRMKNIEKEDNRDLNVVALYESDTILGMTGLAKERCRIWAATYVVYRIQ
jgi:hypothetical protein